MEKRLYKSPSDKVLAGVCGGIGEYFDVDPVLIRVLWVVSAFFGGVGVLAYIIAAIIMPEKGMLNNTRTYSSSYKSSAYKSSPSTDQRRTGNNTSGEKTGGGQQSTQPSDQQSSQQSGPKKVSHDVRDSSAMAGVILVALGGFFLLREFMPWVSGGILAAVLFMALGVFLLVPRAGGKK